MREPTSKTDHKAQYENVIHELIKAGSPSDILGYAADLYGSLEIYQMAFTEICEQNKISAKQANEILKSQKQMIADYDEQTTEFLHSANRKNELCI